MGKIQCKFCKLEEAGKCIKKKTSVKVNKKRNCEYYEVEVKRVTDFAERKLEQEDIPVIFRPDWWWDREKRREARKAAVAKAMEKYKATTADQLNSNPVSQHPLTGDLSRFVGNTAENNEK